MSTVPLLLLLALCLAEECQDLCWQNADDGSKSMLSAVASAAQESVFLLSQEGFMDKWPHAGTASKDHARPGVIRNYTRKDSSTLVIGGVKVVQQQSAAARVRGEVAAIEVQELGHTAGPSTRTDGDTSSAEVSEDVGAWVHPSPCNAWCFSTVVHCLRLTPGALVCSVSNLVEDRRAIRDAHEARRCHQQGAV